MGPELIIERIKQYDPSANFELIEKAYYYAQRAHAGQKRISGEPYIIHPVEVALILTEIEMDTASICAALLHDVIEDTDMGYTVIVNEFGEEIALLVDGVTKLSRINFKSKEDAQAENLRKMFLAMAKDIRVILIKLADRLHNMRTLEYQSERKQKEIALETMEIFAPLAHRLGVFKFKWELEDLSFYYLEPDIYYEIAKRLKQKRKDREEYVHELIQQIKTGLEQIDIKADIKGRPKNIYSIYKKMLKQGKDIDEIYDKIAIRVVVDDVRDCYGVLGIIHTMWKPLPGRFKDYIATPKPNLYQSLHTTLIGKGGEPFEVQIRTWEMHRTAEYGIAAHWRYKEGINPKDKKLDEKLSWLRQILEWQQEVKDTNEFMESLKIDLFDDTVFVFTPKGKVIELPKGACPVDFAYRVHTEVGHQCIGAKVNGRIVPLDFPLNNGDIVEIITSKSSPGPSYDWLNFVKTSSAKSRIKQWFNREKRQANILKGHDLLEKELRKRHFSTKEFLREDKLLEVARRLGYNSADDLCAAIGDGNVTVNQVLNKFKELFFHDAQVDDIVPLSVTDRVIPHRDRDSGALRIKGVDDVAIRLARCCNPLPGDQVLGYITRGRGVSVHRRDCPNLQNYLRTEKDRIIEVEWAEERGIYTVEIEVKAIDRARLTADIMNIIADMRINILSVFSRATKNDLAIMNLKLEIKDMPHMYAVIQRLQKVKDVLEVRRVLPGEVRGE
ncbi:MAG TPA: bifunctional (p)ppGpp synthetase/guanosine-3',5'-bis(diphosphate) 3'-pyrophosphohydrolase [Syntrophomonadaceae bacterium]|nr:bifunctional (p)ppGpp synthetase/guanosine-3',5'-bis(diphosphate) 3'-pyrophosphohydrolase [Syntrophomonadaceae bacterium]HQA06807.1 bifunctional (p)ppGpp synthetase/guanosine-3',5'-bis(diphosphate) 3'-pyrophosphohydrolase [Syntrophomonadaceae bacterium]HQE22739.1 bifunctional (p)ppGpp synthetase/guanosine-3',5'-bis(diphosphate) 3'-pyrophosphohydrolase [Syntrophomonadaceae bacterium]